MDKGTLEFVRLHKDKLTGRVLEIGSFNVNGSVREVIDIAVGVDLRKGKGVDLVCPVQDLKKHFPDGSFDACVSTATLEHIEDWRGFVNVTWDLVKPGGYLVITMASLFKGRHDYPHDYWRMTEDHIRTIYPHVKDFGLIGKNVSIGWTVKKRGKLGNLDFEPIKIK